MSSAYDRLDDIDGYSGIGDLWWDLESTGIEVIRDSQDRLQFLVAITDEMRSWAEQQSRAEVDKYDSREQDNKQSHAIQGKVGEVALAAVLKRYKDEWKVFENGFEKGDIIVEHLGIDIHIDVKTRVENNARYSDLLVGCRSTGTISDIKSGAYVQALTDEDFTTVLLTGWARTGTVRDAPWFQRAQTYPTKIVDHHDLRSLDFFFDTSSLDFWFKDSE